MIDSIIVFLIMLPVYLGYTLIVVPFILILGGLITGLSFLIFKLARITLLNLPGKKQIKLKVDQKVLQVHPMAQPNVVYKRIPLSYHTQFNYHSSNKRKNNYKE